MLKRKERSIPHLFWPPPVTYGAACRKNGKTRSCCESVEPAWCICTVPCTMNNAHMHAAKGKISPSRSSATPITSTTAPYSPSGSRPAAFGSRAGACPSRAVGAPRRHAASCTCRMDRSRASTQASKSKAQTSKGRRLWPPFLHVRHPPPCRLFPTRGRTARHACVHCITVHTGAMLW